MKKEPISGSSVIGVDEVTILVPANCAFDSHQTVLLNKKNIDDNQVILQTWEHKHPINNAIIIHVHTTYHICTYG